MRSKLRRRIAATLVAVAVATSVAACSTRASYDQVILYYSAGTGDDNKFVECIQPGQSGNYPIDDQTFALPTTLRTWSIRKDGSGDSPQAIDSGTKPGADGQPGPHVLTYTTAEFYLNTNCGTGKDANADPNSPLVQFWQNIGSRPWGSDNKPIVSDGDTTLNTAAWKAMLENTIVAAEEKVLADGTRFYSADDLDGNPAGQRAQLEQRMAPAFQTELRSKLGGDYFCGVGYRPSTTVTWTQAVQTGTAADGSPIIEQQQQSGTCPPVRISITDVDFADPGIAKARASVYQATQDAKAKLIAAQAELDQSKILGQAANDPAYLKYKEIQAQLAAAQACQANPNCTVIIDGTGNAGVLTGK